MKREKSKPIEFLALTFMGMVLHWFTPFERKEARAVLKLKRAQPVTGKFYRIIKMREVQ